MIAFFWLIYSFFLITVQSYPGEIITSCYLDNPQIHLSFDDAVTFPQTDNILDVLQEYNISATFYVLTSLITDPNYNETFRVIERMKNEGHTIGNHGHNHYNLITLNETQIKYEIDLSTSILSDLLGYKPNLFRPPYGGVNDIIQNYLKLNGYTIVLWNVGNVDWYYNDSVLSNQAMCGMVTSMGGIFVMHNDYQGLNNGDSLSKLIQTLNVDYNYNYSAPFNVPHDNFEYVSFLQCIMRSDVNDIPEYFIINNIDDNTDNTLIVGLIIAIFIAVIVSFMFGYFIRSKYKLVTRISLLCADNCCGRSKNYDEMKPLTNL